jgi:hypothetical protein
MVWIDDVSMTSPALLNDVGQASSLSLCSNDRVGCVYWARGSKLSLLTSFSYFNCYFLILGFLCSCYLLVSLRLSWLHGNQISLPVLSYLGHSKVVGSTCAPHVSSMDRAVSSEQDVCGTLVVDSVPSSFLIPALCQRFLVQTSVWRLHIIPFFFTHEPQACTFLHDISFS